MLLEHLQLAGDQPKLITGLWIQSCISLQEEIHKQRDDLLDLEL